MELDRLSRNSPLAYFPRGFTNAVPICKVKGWPSGCFRQARSLSPVHLGEASIAQTICQVRFSPILRLRQEDAVIPFQEAIRDRYPNFQGDRAVSVILTPDGVSQQENPDRLWRFASQEDGFTVVLTTNFVALETSNYGDVDDLCSRLRDALALVQEHYAPAKATRVGLRFINEIRFDRKDLAAKVVEAFDPVLLGVAGADEFSAIVQSSRQLLRCLSLRTCSSFDTGFTLTVARRWTRLGLLSHPTPSPST